MANDNEAECARLRYELSEKMSYLNTWKSNQSSAQNDYGYAFTAKGRADDALRAAQDEVHRAQGTLDDTYQKKVHAEGMVSDLDRAVSDLEWKISGECR